MLTAQDLAPLRLRPLLGLAADLVEHEGWEWMDHRWWYEGIGFTWFGRLERQPEATAAFELSFDELSAQQVMAVTSALDLRTRPGMFLPELVTVFGAPVAEQSLVSGRVTHGFAAGASGAFRLEATVDQQHGLVHLSAIRSDLL